MKPTPKLRYVMTIKGTQIVKVLQQWWEQEGMSMNLGWTGDIPVGEVKGEWRDVPLEEEK